MTLEELFTDYLYYHSSFIHEMSGNIKEDLIKMVKEAKKHAESLGLVWDDSFVKKTDLDCINDYR